MGRFSATLSRIGEAFTRLDPGPYPFPDGNIGEQTGYRARQMNKPGSELVPPKDSQTRRKGYEYGVMIGGSTSESVQSAYSQERIQILTQLYQAYLTCPWVSGPVDLIARTATAGGLNVVVEDISLHKGKVPDDPPEVQRLRRLIKFCNPREDMVQLLRQTAIDLLLFGDAYIEVVELLNEPIAMYTLDATTMTVLCDEHGEVTGYKQDVDGIRSAKFDKDQVIHISLDAPRGGMYGVGPAQKALLPVTAWLFTEATIKENFRRGDPPRLHVDLGTMKDNDVQRWREMYTVNNLGPKSVGAPVITTGGGVVGVLDPRKVQDYLATSKQLRDEIISCFGTPPSKLGIIETGNIGAGTGEAQDKTFRVNTIYPIQALILEKLNYQLLQKGFDIQGWHLEFGEIDMRDSEVVERIRDTRLRNGSYTLNRYRDEIGEPPVEGGDDPVLIDRQNIVMWANMDALSQAGIAYKLKGTALAPTEPAEGQPLQLEKPTTSDDAGSPLAQPPQPPQAPPAPKLDPFASPGPSTGPDAKLPPADRPGGPRDAAQGTGPRETRYTQDRRKLRDSWNHSYAARRRMALKELAAVVEGSVFVEDGAVDGKHHDGPEYSPEELGIKGALSKKEIDPKMVNVDHRYQRPLDPKRVEHFAKHKGELKDSVGLVAIRSDGSMWAVSGQHHTAAAVEDCIPKMTYQTFRSTGWRMEKRIYENYAKWHAAQHGLTKV